VRPAVFLDRDGTLIEGEGYLGDPAGVRAIPGARDAVRLIEERGYLRIVVTNQSGVARGYFSDADYAAVAAATAHAVGPFDAQYACFHLAEGSVAPWNVACDCRKPLPGLITRAAAEWDVDLARSVLVGDDLRDLHAAVAAGVEPILVRTGKGARNEPLLAESGLAGARVVDSLLDVARALPSACEGTPS
jgi:D-glycero-D-manno-heptose 1,7-bisphosphate phosphatase